MDTALSSESTTRRSGRRALSAVPDFVETPDSVQYIGRRFVAGLRYGASPDAEAIAATEIPVALAAPAAPLVAPAEVDELDNVLKFEPRTQRPRLGYAHMIAAVAAVSGLAFAAITPGQDVDEVASDTKRVAQTAVADVKAPVDDEVKIERASLTSEFTEEDKLATVVTASGGDVTKVESGGVLAQPLDTVRLTSRFGFRKNPTGPGFMNHNGLDYGAACGTPVKASAAGTVVQSEFAGHSGNRVQIDHGNGLETSYNHNSALKVSVGQKVKRGEVVALVGTTGNSTGCHVHLEVIVNGKWVNPEAWL
ncbi:M23 family metallopeptidase [Paeniglutamicibacter sulfureus]|uniref:M23 family metallopeptidase n=1 Tax=Paeniglutamicibacter sulfureus TaxID=43666 RepID=UPI002665D610|nr:M23 family metallopeptidase [Paeniglutamicibacter sulfureus]MDO2934084.1 M23 family metallopeptidase [Paeniglutamicibacter sulfureus]